MTERQKGKRGEREVERERERERGVRVIVSE